MLSDHFKELKTKMMRIGKIDPNLEIPMRKCIRHLSQAVNFEELFLGETSQILLDLQTGISQNSRDIITICLRTKKITASDITEIQQKIDDNERLIEEFKAKVNKQIIDT